MPRLPIGSPCRSMPNQDLIVTGTPVDLVAALSLDTGQRYECQNLSPTATLLVREQVAAPLPTDRGFQIEARSHYQIQPDGTHGLWAWTDDPSERCPLTLTESM